MPSPEAYRGGAGRGPNPNNAPANNPYPTSRPGEGSGWIGDRMNQAFHSRIEQNETRGIIGNTREFIRMHGGERMRRVFETVPSIDREIRLKNEMARTISELDQGRVNINTNRVCGRELQAAMDKLNLPPGGRAVIALEGSNSYVVVAGDGRAQVLMANPNPKMYKQHLKDVVKIQEEEAHLEELRNAMSRRTFTSTVGDVAKWTLNLGTLGIVDMRTRSRIQRTENRLRNLQTNEAAYRGVYGPIEAAIRADLQAIADPNIAATRQAKAVLTKEDYDANKFGMRRYSAAISKMFGINADTRLLHDAGNTLADAARDMVTGRARRTMFEGIQLVSANAAQGRVNVMGEPTTAPSWVRAAAQQSIERRTREAVRQEMRTAFEARANAQNLTHEVALTANEQRDIANIVRRGLQRRDQDPQHRQTIRQEAVAFTMVNAAGNATMAVMINNRGDVQVRQLAPNGNAQQVRNTLNDAMRVTAQNFQPAEIQTLRNNVYIQNANVPVARPQLQYVLRVGAQTADNRFGEVQAPPAAPAQPRPAQQQQAQRRPQNNQRRAATQPVAGAPQGNGRGNNAGGNLPNNAPRRRRPNQRNRPVGNAPQVNPNNARQQQAARAFNVQP